MIAIPPPQPGTRPRWRDRTQRTRYRIPAAAYYYAVGLITGAASAATLALLIR